MRSEPVLVKAARIAVCAILVVVLFGALSRPAEAGPAEDWRLDFVIVSVDPEAPLELYNPQGDPEDRLTERVKGVVLNGLLDATNGHFRGNRPVVLLAVVRRFDGLSTGGTVLAGGEMRATIDVWFADARTTEELTRPRTLDVTRITLGNVGGIFAHFIGGSQTTRYSRSVAAEAREWLAGLDTLTTSALPAPGSSAPMPAPRAVVPAPVPAPAVVAEPLPVPEPVPEPMPEIAALPDPAPEAAPALADRSPIGGIGPIPDPEPFVVAAAPDPAPIPEPVTEPETAPLAADPEVMPEPEPEVMAAIAPEPEPERVAPGALDIFALPEPAAEPIPEPATPPAAEVVPAAPVPDAPAPAPVTAGTDRVAVVATPEGGPTLANARWVGFSAATYSGSESESGLWIAGPFDRDQREGWITDTATGSTTRVTFIWREPTAGSPQAVLSREAAAALGLEAGQTANVAVYLPR